MAYITVDYSFSNSTTADATQVNANFSSIIAGTSDGTKDFSINALTCAGAATLNGNVNLGNASSDDLTITASLASTLAIKTTYSYDIGSSSIGLRSLYLGSADSAARGTRLIGATVASGYTFTLPTSGGTIGQHLTTDGSGTTSWRYADKATAKTTTYTATGDETVIACDATSAAFTVTLPAAASYTGKRYVIKKTDSSTNAVTIDGNSSETIDGATTTTINTQYEAIEIVCDGSNWHTIQRRIPSAWNSSLTITPSAGFGTTSLSTIYTSRRGDSLRVRGAFKFGTIAGSTAYLELPTGIAIDYGKLSTLPKGLVGRAQHIDASTDGAISISEAATSEILNLFTDGSTTNQIYMSSRAGNEALTKRNVNAFAGNNDSIAFEFEIPVTGWNG